MEKNIERFLKQILKLDPARNDNPAAHLMYEMFQDVILEWEKNRPIFVKK